MVPKEDMELSESIQQPTSSGPPPSCQAPTPLAPPAPDEQVSTRQRGSSVVAEIAAKTAQTASKAVEAAETALQLIATDFKTFLIPKHRRPSAAASLATTSLATNRNGPSEADWEALRAAMLAEAKSAPDGEAPDSSDLSAAADANHSARNKTRQSSS